MLSTFDLYIWAQTGGSKDVWDKAEILGSILTGIVVALLGAYFTWLYNRQQNRTEDRRRAEDAAAAAAHDASERKASEERAAREHEAQLREARLNQSELMVRRVQAVQSLLPELKSGVQRDRRAALLAVQALGDSDFAAGLARIFGGPAGISALVSLSLVESSSPNGDRASALLSGLTKRLRHSVAQINVPQIDGTYGVGSGFSVRPDTLLTAAHVTDSSVEGTMHVGEGKWSYSWRLVKRSEDFGLALLECDAPMVPLTLSDADPSIEDDVLVVGWDPSQKGWAAHPGIVLAPPQRDDRSSHRWVMPAEIGSVPGFSGAPVVNSSLEVVAVHYKKFRETNIQQRGLAHMISLSTLKAFLND